MSGSSPGIAEGNSAGILARANTVSPPPPRPLPRRQAEERAAARKSGEVEPGFNPWQILRVSRGTTFDGLRSARDLALARAASPDGRAPGDPPREAGQGPPPAPGEPAAPSAELVHRAFDFFVDASRRRVERIAEENPTSADAAFQVANLRQTLGEAAGAAAALERALALDPTHLPSLQSLGQLQRDGPEGIRDAERAEKTFQTAVLLAGGDACRDVDLLFDWALLRLRGGDLEGTAALIGRVVEARPDLAEHPLVKELGIAAVKKGGE